MRPSRGSFSTSPSTSPSNRYCRFSHATLHPLNDTPLPQSGTHVTDVSKCAARRVKNVFKNDSHKADWRAEEASKNCIRIDRFTEKEKKYSKFNLFYLLCLFIMLLIYNNFHSLFITLQTTNIEVKE